MDKRRHSSWNRQFGARLRAIRERLKISQTELALHMGLSRFAIIQYEHGRTNVSVPRLEHFARVLGCTTDDLTNFDGPFPPRGPGGGQPPQPPSSKDNTDNAGGRGDNLTNEISDDDDDALEGRAIPLQPSFGIRRKSLNVVDIG